MAYFLQLKNDNGNYRTLDIEKCDLFQSKNITKTYKRSGGYKIQELDRFTMLFDDEQDLKKYLFNAGILPESWLNGKIIIRFIKKDRVKNYDLLFKEDLAYFYIPNSIVSLVLEKFELGDFKFLNDLARNFYWYRECSSTAAELVNLTELAINNGIVDNGFREYDSNGDNVVSRLIKLLTYKYSQSSNGKITYQEEFNWRTFHSLINFINSYDRDLKIQNTVEDSKHIVRAKKREIPKQEDIEDFEQLSFKDLI